MLVVVTCGPAVRTGISVAVILSCETYFRCILMLINSFKFILEVCHIVAMKTATSFSVLEKFIGQPCVRYSAGVAIHSLLPIDSQCKQLGCIFLLQWWSPVFLNFLLNWISSFSINLVSLHHLEAENEAKFISKWQYFLHQVRVTYKSPGKFRYIDIERWWLSLTRVAHDSFNDWWPSGPRKIDYMKEKEKYI